VLDYSILLGTMWREGMLSQEEVEQRLPKDSTFRERFKLYQRALVLDQVIDALADWVESDFTPEYQAEVRSVKESIHCEAFELYNQLYY
jgi:hypothetical protein